MARCAIEVETLEGARMQCEITAGHPGPHMNGIRGLVPGSITWEWRAAFSAAQFLSNEGDLIREYGVALSAGFPQETHRQI